LARFGPPERLAVLLVLAANNTAYIGDALRRPVYTLDGTSSERNLGQQRELSDCVPILDG